jgi:glycerol-3-phosphate acyltransferase PlsX
MATEFVKEILGIDNPSIGLLNVGEEDSKGNEFSKQTFELLKNNIKNFHGNVEGKDVFLGTTDVIVCDGFTGNVVLKSSEQLAKMFFSLIKNGVTQKLRYKIGAYLMKGCFKKIKKLTSDSEYGGAQLLGVNGYCTICHGNSSALAIKNAIRVSKEFYEKSINDKIKQRIIDINK